MTHLAIQAEYSCARLMRSTGSTWSTLPAFAWVSKNEIVRFAEPFPNMRPSCLRAARNRRHSKTRIRRSRQNQRQGGRGDVTHTHCGRFVSSARPWPVLPAVVVMARGNCRLCFDDAKTLMRITARWLITGERPEKRRRWTSCRSRASEGAGCDGGFQTAQASGARARSREGVGGEVREAGRPVSRKPRNGPRPAFILTRPPIPDGPPDAGKSADEAVLQASGAKNSLT